jgi:hypothetical protein
VAGYHIDDQVLHDVLRALDQGGTAVTAADSSVRDAVTSQLGTPALDGAAGDLVAGWAATLTAISASVADTSAGVRQCLARYSENEARIAAALGRDGWEEALRDLGGSA